MQTTTEAYNHRITELAMQQARWGNKAEVVGWARCLMAALAAQSAAR